MKIPTHDIPEPKLISQSLAKRLTKEDYSPERYYNLPLLISYDLIDIDKTEFRFDNEAIDLKDSLEYYNTLSVMSQYTFNELLDMSYGDQKRIFGDNLHFSLEPIQGRRVLKTHLKRLIPNINFENELLIIQFALYTDKKGACEICKRKSPRIYGLLGNKGVVHMLFYDPYHKTHPTRYVCPECNPD